MKVPNRFNHYERAFNYLILVSAFVHVGSVILYSILTHNYDVLNIFHIVGLDMFFSQLGNGVVAFSASIVTTLAVYIGILWYIRKGRLS